MEDDTSLTPRSTDIKAFIQHLNSALGTLRSDLHKNKMLLNSTKNEMTSMDNRDVESLNSITKSTLDELERLEVTFHNFSSEDKKEFVSVKQSFSSLNQDKMKLAQSTMLLEARVENMERNLGVELVLPSLRK